MQVHERVSYTVTTQLRKKIIFKNGRKGMWFGLFLGGFYVTTTPIFCGIHLSVVRSNAAAGRMPNAMEMVIEACFASWCQANEMQRNAEKDQFAKNDYALR